MALKDAVQKILLNSLTASNFASIAVELGFNYKAISDSACIMYLGDNSDNGFCFELSYLTLTVSIYCQDSKKEALYWFTYDASYLYYIKGKDTIAFGSTNTGTITLQFMCGKATNVVDGSIKYGYLLGINESYTNAGAYVMSDGYYKSNWFPTTLWQTSDYFAQFYQMCSHQGDLFDNVYLAIMFRKTTDYQLFTMNGKNYASLNMGNENGMRYITEF